MQQSVILEVTLPLYVGGETIGFWVWFKRCPKCPRLRSQKFQHACAI